MPSGARLLHQTEVIRNIRIGATRQLDKVGRAQRIETEVEATECRRIVPVKTGNLKGTIHAVGPEEQRGRIVTAVVAGGPAAPYAERVHEDLEAFHPNGEAKYIEGPLRASAPYMAERIARRARTL